MKRHPLWFLFNIYGWLIFAMSVVTAVIVDVWWIALLGVIGYQIVLFVEVTWGGALGRTGRVRLAKAEQENKELRDEQARLIGAIRERDQKVGKIERELAELKKSLADAAQPAAKINQAEAGEKVGTQPEGQPPQGP